LLSQQIFTAVAVERFALAKQERDRSEREVMDSPTLLLLRSKKEEGARPNGTTYSSRQNVHT